MSSIEKAWIIEKVWQWKNCFLCIGFWREWIGDKFLM